MRIGIKGLLAGLCLLPTATFAQSESDVYIIDLSVRAIVEVNTVVESKALAATPASTAKGLLDDIFGGGQPKPPANPGATKIVEIKGSNVVRASGYDPKTHALAAVDGSLVIWDKRQSRKEPGNISQVLGSFEIGPALTLSDNSELALVSLTLNSASPARVAPGADQSIHLQGSMSGRIRRQAAAIAALGPGGLLSIAPADGNRGSQGSIELCAVKNCSRGYVTTANISINFNTRLGYVVNAPVDSDGDGYPDEADSCPSNGDEGYGIDGSGCPNPPPTDSDLDGYPDDADSCPSNGDLGYGVDGNGCPNPPPPQDTDSDGVQDIDDQCPNEGDLGYGVDSNGCPFPGGNYDSDNDGYPDDVDACVNDGDQGNGVDSTGCPNPAPSDSDSDGDGVDDSVDQCPMTPAGVTVDSAGCPVPT